jgi:hypothetical protein
MAANSLGESGGNWQTNPGDGGASHGLFQWNGDRLAAFQAANGGKLPGQTSLDAQLDFATNEWKADHNGAATAAGRFGTAEGKIAPIVSKYEVSANQPADIARRSAYLNQLRAAGVGRGAAPAASPPFNPNAGPRVAGAPPAGAPSPTATPGFGPLTPVPSTPTVPGQADVPTPVTPSPVALRTGGTDVAGPGAGPDTTLPSVAQPNQLYQTGLPGVTISGPASNALAPPAAAAAAPAAPVAQAPAAVPAPPATRPATGQNSPQFQAALELNRRAQALDLVVDPTGRTKALAASLRAQAALYMQADSVVKGPGGVQIHTLTGKEDDAAKPAERWVQQPNGTLVNAATGDVKSAPTAAEIWDKQPDGTYLNRATGKPQSAVTPAEAWVKQPDGTFVNLATGKPMFPPTPRLTTQEGVGVLEALPGGGVRVVSPTNPEGIVAQRAAEAQGKGVGGDVAKQMPALVAQGREATQAIGNIDYGMSQLEKARQGGITTGYFADALATTAARLKSLGLPTDKIPFINVDPSAVGNIQTAQKTLAIVSSAILKQALGDSQITDAKIQHFIHAQPGIETDPQALGRVLNWARSQFVYENEMSRAAVAEAANSPTGTLPLNWQAKYFRDKGFAPIYDRSTGEMQQPEGRAPTREPPPGPPATAPINPSARTLDMVYQTPKGPLKWTSDGWVAP